MQACKVQVLGLKVVLKTKRSMRLKFVCVKALNLQLRGLQVVLKTTRFIRLRSQKLSHRSKARDQHLLILPTNKIYQ
jgi:hypothetical protein